MSEGSSFHGSSDDHGASVAAWFGVVGLILASAVIGLGIWLNTGAITAAGVVMAAVILVIAIILAKAGYGVAAQRRKLAEERAAREPGGLRRRAAQR